MPLPSQFDTKLAIAQQKIMKNQGKDSVMNQPVATTGNEVNGGLLGRISIHQWLATLAVVSITSLAQAATVEQMLPSGVTLKTATVAQLQEAAKQSAATDSEASSANISEALKKRHDLASTKAIVGGGIEGVKLRYASSTGATSDGKSLSDGKKNAVLSECPEIQSLVASAVRTTPSYTQQILDLSIKAAPDCVLPAVAEGYSSSGVLERHFDFSLLGPNNPSSRDGGDPGKTIVDNPTTPSPAPDPTVSF